MVNFRRFNGTADVITLGLGTAINTITFGTMAVLCRRTTNNTWNGPFCTRSSGADAEMYLDIAPSSASPASVLWCSFAAGQNNNNAFTITAADDWVWVVITKATGSVAPRYHKYVMSTQTWTRGNGAGNIANATSPSGGSLQIGNVAGDFFDGDIAAVAVWTTALSDATLNTIPNNWVSGVLAASPQAAWLLNQASTGTSLSDAVGTANQTAITGTSVQSGTIANWSESSTTPISGTDTASGAEATVSLTAVVPATDTTVSADTGTVSAAVTSADTAAGLEVSALAVAGGDTSTTVDSISVAATLAGQETGAMADNTLLALTGVETSTSTDSGSLAAALSGVDTVSSTDVGSIPGGPVPISGVDTSSSVETGGIGIADEDTGQSRNADDDVVGTDSATAHEVSRVFSTNESTASAVESALLAVRIVGSDTTAVTETGSRPALAPRLAGSVTLVPGGKARLVTTGGRTEEA